MIVRLDKHCENLDNIIQQLKDGDRILSPMDTAKLLEELQETIKNFENAQT